MIQRTEFDLDWVQEAFRLGHSGNCERINKNACRIFKRPTVSASTLIYERLYICFHGYHFDQFVAGLTSESNEMVQYPHMYLWCGNAGCQSTGIQYSLTMSRILYINATQATAVSQQWPSFKFKLIISLGSHFSLLFVVDDWQARTFASPLLVGTYANSILYTLELVAVIQYYTASKHNKDSLPLQGMVYFTFVVDAASTTSAYACVYLVCN